MPINPHKYLIVLTGPTAIGKTALSLELVEHFDSIIISADSRQVYKEMSIGTAKPSAEEIERGKMQLVDHISIETPYSAGIYEKEAIDIIHDSHEQGQIPILCGGTGLYIKAICEGLDKMPAIEKEIIQTLDEDLEQKGLSVLQAELEAKDPQYYARADIQNSYRVIRALSVIRQTGKPFSSYLSQTKAERKFTPIYIVLDMERAQLYDRINQRVLAMVEEGLIKEVESLIPYRDLRALNTVGYSEVFEYLDGNVSLDEAINLIQRNSRRYAKRQSTWNRNQITSSSFHPSELSKIISYIEGELK